MKLENRVVMITGASRGLGKALVAAFLAHSSKVAAIVRSEESVQGLTRCFGSNDLLVIKADVSDPKAIVGAVNKIQNKFGPVEILFNNAAIYTRADFLDESAEQWMEAINTNINGTAFCCKAVLPGMIANGFGRIFNVGSFADKAPIARSAAYSASKGALHALTKAVAKDIEECAADVEVHEWIPGHMNTQMSDYTGQAPAVSAQWAVEIASGKVPYTSKSTLFENNREWVAPLSLKQKLASKLLFWR